MSEQLIDGQVIPYPNGRRSNDTRTWRDATCLEMSQAQQIQELEDKVSKLDEANQAMLEALKKAKAEFAGLPRSLGYEFDHIEAIDAAIAKGEQK